MRTDARVYIYRYNIRIHATVYQFAEICLDGPSPLSLAVTKTGLVGFHRCQRVGYQGCPHHHPCSPASRSRTIRRCDSTGGSGLCKRHSPAAMHACTEGAPRGPRCAQGATRTRSKLRLSNLLVLFAALVPLLPADRQPGMRCVRCAHHQHIRPARQGGACARTSRNAITAASTSPLVACICEQ
jgi:hypothetical protein